ncbi:MAG TPA: hypothetical protein VK054_13980, partial [Beutenbergiaceae bacterium]|nr:hypothetical protein [Beutenbergiaceae bacterium]
MNNPSPPSASGKRRVPHLAEPLLARIRQQVDGLNQELIAFRRDMHAHPELSRNEHRATKKVAQRLNQAGLHVHLLPETGLWCDIPASDRYSGGPQPLTGAQPRPTVILRADLDALPVEETAPVEFASTNGFAHA